MVKPKRPLPAGGTATTAAVAQAIGGMSNFDMNQLHLSQIQTYI